MPTGRLCFGPFALELESGQLLRGKRALALAAREIAVLRHLIERGGQVVSTDELLESVWADTFVVRGAVKTSIHRVRAALGDTQNRAKYLETIGRRGYRFIAEVRAESERNTSQTSGAPPPESEVSPPGEASAPMRRPRTPFLGRDSDLVLLARSLDAARSGNGGISLVVGEAGIGKTRLLEEFAARARAAGARVVWGRCLEAELSRPFGPFADGLALHASESNEAALRDDVGGFGGIVARVVPELRMHLRDLAEPAPLSPQEERARLLDALAQVLWSIARQQPLVLILDDLHWADGASLGMLRHVARFVRRRQVLLIGAYREEELDRQHPLAQALIALGHDIDLERLRLAGLGRESVAELVEALGAGSVPAAFVDALTAETAGNPLFVRELVLHLLEEEALGGAGERTGWRLSLEQSGVPDRVREVVGHRLSRLSEGANRLLATASGCAGPFRFDVVAAVSGLDLPEALDALEAALRAEILRETAAPDVYEFTHAMLRHSLYTDLSLSRRVRLHRRLAAELERAYGADAEDHSLEIAQQWHRSAALPGADAGMRFCELAATRAAAAAAHEEEAAALRMALDLVAPSDPRRPRLLARLALACAWSLAHDDAVRASLEAADLIAADEGADAAAEFLADAAEAVHSSAFDPRAWVLAESGLRFLGGRRDLTWARLRALDLDRRDANDPDFPGVPLDSADRREASRILVANWSVLPAGGIGFLTTATVFESREDARERGALLPVMAGFCAGEYRRAIARFEETVPVYLKRGQLALAALSLNFISRCKLALGKPDTVNEEAEAARRLVERLGSPPFLVTQLGAIPLEMRMFRGEGYEALIPLIEAAFARSAPESRSVVAMISAFAALFCAHAGRADEAMRALERTLPAIRSAPGWAANYTASICYLIEVLWQLERSDFLVELEKNLREKTLAPDFRYVNVDARAALARLCALTGRFDEARTFFGEARRVLDEQGALPLRAITDFDEARMELMRRGSGDRKLARMRLASARRAFESLGMTGWFGRAESLRQSLDG